jgi:hypothetical protein
MPYIAQEKRDVLDPVVDQLINTLRQLESDDPNNNSQANISYVLSRLLDRMYVANYQEINNACGMLFAAALEYYRKVAVPYENQKAFDNGDVYKLETPQTVVEDYIDLAKAHPIAKVKQLVRGLTEVVLKPGITTVYHGGNMGDTVKDVQENIDALFGDDTFNKMIEHLLSEQGSPDYMYELKTSYVPSVKLDD